MRTQRQRMWAWGLSLAVSVLISLPYLFAQNLATPDVFTGFLINPTDGFSYLAKMREGARGSWTFTLPYAAEAGDGVLLYLYYLLLGQLAGLIGAPLMVVYHLARIASATLMFYMAFQFYGSVFRNVRWIWTAFVLTLLGAGLGWLGVLFGVDGSDLTIPESIPLFSAYTNAHFPLAIAAVLGAGRACLRTQESRFGEAFQGWFWGTILVLVLPFSTAGIGAAMVVWLVWEAHSKRGIIGRDVKRLFMLPGVPAFAGYLLGVLPWLVYNVWVVLTHPVISGWTAQNQTRSPPISSYLIGYSPLLIFAVLGYLRGYPMRRRETRFIAVWLIVNTLLLYVPVSVQRRMNLGLYIPLTAMAVLGMAGWFSPSRLRAVAALMIALTLPSLALMIGTGIFGVEQGLPELVYEKDEIAAYRWLAEELPEGALVLAGAQAGNRIPAFSSGRVLYGHPFETPQADAMLALLDDLYNPALSSSERYRLLESYDVDFIFAGPSEAALGFEDWAFAGEVVYSNPSVRIYQVRDHE